MKKYHAIIYLLSLFSLYSPASAGEANVVGATAGKEGAHSYNFRVTVQHADSGWEHYADKWDVLDEEGNILGTRILHHPHVREQPFTRNLHGVEIPDDVEAVIIRAHDSVHKYGGMTVTVQLP